MKLMEKKHAILVAEFDRYIIEHLEFAKKIPRNAQHYAIAGMSYF